VGLEIASEEMIHPELVIGGGEESLAYMGRRKMWGIQKEGSRWV
jgi:hypothetical protein